MKKAFLIVLFCTLSMAAHANDSKEERYNDWFINSYNFGKSGNNCSDIYFNYGTPQWTFNSEDPDFLEQLFNACEIGRTDELTGQNNLKRILDAWNRDRFSVR